MAFRRGHGSPAGRRPRKRRQSGADVRRRARIRRVGQSLNRPRHEGRRGGFRRKKDIRRGRHTRLGSNRGYSSGISSELLYDANGRISTQDGYSAKGPQARSEYRYDESGRLVEETLLRGGHRLLEVMAYAEDGSIKRGGDQQGRESSYWPSRISTNGRVEELYENGSYS